MIILVILVKNKMEGEIKKIIIDRLTDEQITYISDCIINRQANNTFFENCVYDRHMGVCDRGKICEVCSADWAKCIGGYGLIKLPISYYFPGNSKLITYILQFLCCKCSLFLIDEEELESSLNPTRLKVNTKLQNLPFYKIIAKKKRKCICGGENLFVFERKTKEDKKKWEFEFQTDEGNVVPIQKIKSIFKNVDTSVLNKLKKIGIKTHPDTLLIDNLIVVPVYLRPYMVKDNQYLHNDLSTIYNSIIKEVSKKTISQRTLFEKIEMLLTQKKSKPLPNSSKVPQSFQDRIQGKEGIINANINGKRVNHSSRTTITGWPDGKLGEVGIPEIMAEKMTLQVPVALIKDIKSWIKEHQPFRLTKKSGACFRFTTEKTTARIIANIESSDLLERKAVDGDIVLFNRQPSLRPESIIAKKIKIIKNGNTFRLTLPCTPPLNADFDGDECNVHILQHLPARVECYELMNPAEQLISTQKGTPLITPVQDALIGSYILTETAVQVSRNFLFNIVMLLNLSVDFLNTKIDYWNQLNLQKVSTRFEKIPGRFIFSLVLENINFVHHSNSFMITNGIITDQSCAINKKILCGGVNSLIHNYIFLVGKWETCVLIDKIQSITNSFLAYWGFTIGLNDCLEQKCYTDRLFYNKKNINTALGIVETQMLKMINRQKDKLSNNFLKVVKSGAKGSMTNVVQVTQIVGQQSIDGTKMRNEMKSLRTLACFPKNQTGSIYSTGFVFHCFFEGLDKSENYFHCKAGRRGVADSVTKVSESGYLAKKICKFMEDYVVEHDLTVRHNSTKQIIQFKFGSDGFNPQQLPAVNGKQSYLSKLDFVKSEIKGTREEQIAAICIYLLKSMFGLNKKNFLNTELQHTIAENCFFEETTGTTNFNNENGKKINGIILGRFFEPGTPIGLICGTNFGEISSQLLLKSFHHSGIKSKDISGGIKRLTQLLCRTTGRTRENVVVVARIKDPIYNYLKTVREITDHRPTKEICKILMEDIATTLINKIKIVQFETFVTSVIYEGGTDFFIKKNPILRENEFQILFYLNPNELENYDSNSVKVFKLLNDHYKDDEDIFLRLRENVIEMKLISVQLNDLPKIKKKCLSLNISITNNEASVQCCDLEFNDSYNEFEVIFKGQSLAQVLSIPFVDEKFAYSTDPFENKILGIESARQSLYKEIFDVLTFDGADINKRYISLICDAMCHSGCIKSIAHTEGVLTSAFFEKEVKKLNFHSTEKSEDLCTSLEACVFLGKICRMGTGFIDVLKQ